MNSYKMALDVMQDLAGAMENGEYDFDGTREKKANMMMLHVFICGCKD
jgi:hypothetical protein